MEALSELLRCDFLAHSWDCSTAYACPSGETNCCIATRGSVISRDDLSDVSSTRTCPFVISEALHRNRAITRFPLASCHFAVGPVSESSAESCGSRQRAQKLHCTAAPCTWRVASMLPSLQSAHLSLALLFASAQAAHLRAPSRVHHVAPGGSSELLCHAKQSSRLSVCSRMAPFTS